MRAAAFTGFGGPSQVDIREVATPALRSGEVLLDVTASSLNHHDYWYLKGRAPIDEDDLPFVSGVDVAGTVAEVGPTVDGVASGDRVLLDPNETCGSCEYCRDGPENRCERFSLYHGGFAEKAVVPADRLLSVPDTVSLVDAGALPVAYMTAWHMIRRAGISPADTILIPGATGGVGIAAVQLATAMGAEAIGTTSSPEKREKLLSIGATDALLVTEPAELSDVMADREPVQAVLNHLGGAFTEPALEVLERDGRMVICGGTAGPTSEIDLWDLFLEHKQVIGSTMGTRRDLRRVLDLLATGAFSPLIAATFDIEEAPAAFQAMADRQHVGKLVITPNGTS